MDKQAHLRAIVKGRIGPETARWLTAGVKAALGNDRSLERNLGLTGGIRATWFRTVRDRTIATAVHRLGGIGAFLDEYSLWRLNGGDPPAELEDDFQTLKLLEVDGYTVPSSRQVQRICKKYAERVDIKSTENDVPKRVASG